jgi:hypothetical protein
VASAASGSWLDRLAESVARSDSTHIGFAIALLAMAAGACGYLAWRYLHRARLIEDMPTSRARSAAQGYVELEGVAKQMEHTPIVARLSGLPCCWYRYKVEEMEVIQERGHDRTRWKVIDKGTSTDTFWLDDGTGRVAVDPEGAEVIPRYKDVWQSRSGLAGIAKPSEFFVGFFATHSSATTYRFTEERINRNDPVYALGLLKNLGSLVNGPTLDDRVRDLLKEWKQDQAALHKRFDLNQDGKIDEKEWLLARRAARREAENATSLSRGPRLDPIGEAERMHTETLAQTTEGINLLTHTKDRDRPFIISAFPQKELVARKKRLALFYGAGFFAAGIVAVWLYNTRFG